MTHKSPSKVFRNVKRITKFLENKSKENKFLTVRKLPEVDIPAVKKILTFSTPTIVSILPLQRNLSCTKPVLIDMPPQIPFLPPIMKQNYPIRARPCLGENPTARW